MRDLYLYLKILFVLTSCSADRVVFCSSKSHQNECKRGKTKTGRKKEKEKAN